VDKVKVKWNSIRSCFSRELREEKKSSKSGSGKRKRAVYKYTNNLAFLRPHMKLKTMSDNYSNDEVTFSFTCDEVQHYNSK